VAVYWAAKGYPKRTCIGINYYPKKVKDPTGFAGQMLMLSFIRDKLKMRKRKRKNNRKSRAKKERS
jgi:hypothetical protein